MRRYILAPEAALDLVEIWRYLKNKASVEIAERVERAIRQVLCRLFISDPSTGLKRSHCRL
jgi:plasmid stabilization system protein ParE